MSLTIPSIAEWAVLNGIKKVDTEPTDRSAFTHRIPDHAYWLVADDLEFGARLISITPPAGELPLRLGLTFFASPGCDLVESVDIGGPTAGSIAGMGDASALTPANLPHLYALLAPISAALSAALADDRPLVQADLLQAAGDNHALLNLLEVE